MNSQQNLNALGGDWRLSITDQVRTQNLQNLMAPLLQGFGDSQKAGLINLIATHEKQAYNTSSSSQEYVTTLRKYIADFEQKLKVLSATQPGLLAGNNSQPAAAAGAPNPAVNMMQVAQQQAQAHTPAMNLMAQQPSAAGTNAPASSAPAQPTAGLQLRDTLQFPENHSVQEISMALQLLQQQLNTTPNKGTLTEMMRRLYMELQRRQQQPQAQQQQQQAQPQAQAQQQQQQQQAQAQAQQAQQQQLAQQQLQAALRQQQIASIAAANPQAAMALNNAGAFSQNPQIQQMQLQQLQMRFQQQAQQQQQQQVSQPNLAMHAQLQAMQQGQQALSTAFTNSPQVRPAVAPTPLSASSLATGAVPISTDELQIWKNAFSKITRPFIYGNTHIQINLTNAYDVLNKFKSHGDVNSEAMITKVIHEIIQAGRDEVKLPLTKEVLQMVLNDSASQLAGAKANQQQQQQQQQQGAGGSMANNSRDTPVLANAIRPPQVTNLQQQQQQAGMQGIISSPAMSMGTLAATQGNATAANQAAGNTNVLNPAASALMASSAAAAAAAAAANSPATAPLKKQQSGKNSPSVASSKPKKKSQSPRTASKPRKGSPPKPSQPEMPQQPASQDPAVPGMQRQGSLSTEAASLIVAEIVKSVDVEKLKKQPVLVLSEHDKKVVREQLAVIRQMIEYNLKLLPVIFMSTKSRESVQKIYTVSVIVHEQERLLPEDQYIVGPPHITSFMDILRQSMATAKEWGSQHQQHEHGELAAKHDAASGAPATMPQPAAGRAAELLAANAAQQQQQQQQNTPLTNMHPSAITADPSFENFQKAVKHPLEIGSLKLPVSKKRAMGKNGGVSGMAMADSSSPTHNISAAPTTSVNGSVPGVPNVNGQQHLQQQQHLPHQQVPVPFAPAPIVLPPNMTKAEFERLPPEVRMQIMKSQQAALIRQQTVSISGAPPNGTMAAFAQQQQQQQHQQQQQGNPLLMAAAQGAAAAAGGVSMVAPQSAEEQRLQALERNKWNNPLEYLMCVLDKFTQGAERAGVEPSPILQQAFWPIARKSMSSGWGVVASDAVL
ncbi:hypothetical protein GGI07_002149 [Coemansia sp. Benny D115]|nr:hypothetical protein GGI07_002149 [Coemansia sp. Benny D115]